MIDGRPRLLVTGVTGLLGVALVREAISHFEVLGLARRPEAAPLPCETRSVDLMDARLVAEVVEDFAPHVVVHAAAMTSVDQCERDPELAHAANVGGTNNLLRALDGHPCRFVLVSTDAVFDGKAGHYTERDLPGPVNAYGRSKLEAEEVVLSTRADALVTRTVFYGRNALPKQSLAEWILGHLAAGREVPGFVDVRFSPLLSDRVARTLLELVALRATGLLHVASSDSCSKYEFARELAAAFGFPAVAVVPAVSTDAELVAPRPADTSLAIDRATSILGRALPTVVEGVLEFKAASASGAARAVDPSGPSDA